MSVEWELAFRVGEGSDFETRYSDLYGDGSQIPTECVPDVAKAHDLAASQITDTGMETPYAVFLTGQRDYARPGDVSITVDIQPSP